MIGLLLAIWAIASIVLAGLSSLAVPLFLFDSSRWNFPGDPPFFDLFFLLPVVSSFVSGTFWLLMSKLRLTSYRSPFGLTTAPAAASVIAFALCAAVILERHDARWAAVRNGIRHHGDAIATAVGGRNHVLTSEEFSSLKRQFMPNAIPVELPGYGTVHLRMAHGVYPYIGVDFDNGGHALFEPRTMLCTYSD